MCPSETSSGAALTDPVITYPHVPGGAVIGGAISRSSSLPSLEGEYVFGDFSGRLFAATPAAPDELWDLRELSVTNGDDGERSESLGAALLGIEEDLQGEPVRVDCRSERWFDTRDSSTDVTFRFGHVNSYA